MKKYVIEVSPEGAPLGLVEKLEAHERGVLHLAFSIFVYRDHKGTRELLLQQRAFEKYHSGGLWTNTCCSHAEKDIPIEETAAMRLQEEMGFSCPLQHRGTFCYRADVGNGLIEHEIDHVFTAFYDPPVIKVDPSEAAAWAWVTVSEVEERLAAKPQEFTAWFAGAFAIAKKSLHQ